MRRRELKRAINRPTIAASIIMVLNKCSLHARPRLFFSPRTHTSQITFGKNHLAFWNKRKDGHFERSDVVKGTRVVQCVAFLESGDLVAGDRQEKRKRREKKPEHDILKPKKLP